MSKFKKLTLTCIAVLSAFIFVACSNGVDSSNDDSKDSNKGTNTSTSTEAVEELFDGPADNPEIKLSYNKNVYKYKVEDVLKDSQNFIR